MYLRIILILGLFGCSSVVLADQVVIDDVPSYLWYHGCGPTAAGMVIGYWDAHGFDDLIDGSNDWDLNRQAVEDMIASPGHIRDYVPATDRVGTAADPIHESDCVADFMYASRYPFEYGVSFAGWQYQGMAGYAACQGYSTASGALVQYSSLWDVYVDEIDSARPVELYVDPDGDGTPDHFVVGIGYDDTPGQERYAAYNTYDREVHWYDFAAPAVGQAYGVRSGIWFSLGDPIVSSGIPGDFNGDGMVNADDVDQLAQAVVQLATDPIYDVNGDQRIDRDDVDVLIGELLFVGESGQAAGTAYGDINLDGRVDLDDFVTLKCNFGLVDDGPNWAAGDIDGDGDVDVSDFTLFSNNYGFVAGGLEEDGTDAASPVGTGQSVPEPATVCLLAMGAAGAIMRRRCR